MSALAPTLRAFFTDQLIRQRHAIGHTIAAYRDTLRLARLRHRVHRHRGVRPDIADLDATLIAGFLDHLETQRDNSVRTRNARSGSTTDERYIVLRTLMEGPADMAA